MANVFTAHGNALSLVILDDPIAFPASLTAWNGSTGNVILFNCLAEDGSKNTAKTNPVVYKHNGKKVYAVDNSEVTGETTAKLYLQTMLTNTFMWDGVRAAIAAGKKILEYYNAGYKEGKWVEIFKIVDVVPNSAEEAGNASPLEYMSNAVPPDAAFTVSAANITAWKAVSAAYAASMHCAGPHIIAANEPLIKVYTT